MTTGRVHLTGLKILKLQVYKSSCLNLDIDILVTTRKDTFLKGIVDCYERHVCSTCSFFTVQWKLGVTEQYGQ